MVVLVGVLGATAAAALAATVSWGSAIEVPGIGDLNVGGGAGVWSVSCVSAGACAAGGDYTDGSDNAQAFVVDEQNGVWGTAIEVPGLTALNHKSDDTRVSEISCAKPGFCAAAGNYRDAKGRAQAFVVDEKNGVWGTAIEVPGTAKLNVGGDATVGRVSCANAGSCVAGGWYTGRHGIEQAFLVTEKDGIWRKAIVVPGTASLNHGHDPSLNSISCPTAGNCTAGGSYSPSGSGYVAFVVNERNGVWRNAIQVPGTAKLNAGKDASIYGVSCLSARTCSAGGYYTDKHDNAHAFVVNETHGVWRNAIEVPGAAVINHGGAAEIYAISCGSRGSCAAGGFYLDRSQHDRAFVVSEKRGVWRKALAVPGLGDRADVESVSCAAEGACAAGGFYVDDSGTHAFVLGENGGIWAKPMDVPGTEALNLGGGAGLDSLSCVATGACVAGGSYVDDTGDFQAFVTSP